MPGDLEGASIPQPKPDLSKPASPDEYQRLSTKGSGFRILPPFLDKGPTFKIKPSTTVEAMLYQAAVKKVLQRAGISIMKEKRYNPDEDEDFRSQTWEVGYSKPDVNDKLYSLQDEIEKEVHKLQGLDDNH